MSKITVEDISRQIEESTVALERIEEQRKIEGATRGYIAEDDFERLGFDVSGDRLREYFLQWGRESLLDLAREPELALDLEAYLGACLSYAFTVGFELGRKHPA